jgi:hypothetical protein
METLKYPPIPHEGDRIDWGNQGYWEFELGSWLGHEPNGILSGLKRSHSEAFLENQFEFNDNVRYILGKPRNFFYLLRRWRA